MARLCHLLRLTLLAPAAVALAQPTITRFPNSQVVPVGGNVTFTVEATGTAPLTYQWSRGATPIAGATAPTLTLSNLTADDAGIYAVSVTDTTGTAQTFLPFASGFGAGYQHLLYLKSDRSLWGVGSDQYGQLGLGSVISYRTQPTRIATDVITATGGFQHTLFLKSDGTLWAMGYNFYGQLGNGTTSARSIPEQIASNVTAIAAGAHHSLFIKSDGTLWAMGNNSGQLGDGTAVARATPVQVASGVRAAAAGASHSLFLKTDGTLWGMGGNNYGQLGDGTTTTRLTPIQIATDVTAIAAGSTHSLFVKTDGSAWGFGSNASGQLGDNSQAYTRLSPVQIIASGVRSVAAGAFHSLFLRTDGTLLGVGYNAYGQLGDKIQADRSTPAEIATGVTDVVGGEYSTYYRRTDGTLWGSGYNAYGQFGDGSTLNRSAPAPLLGPSDTPAVLTVNLPPTIVAEPSSMAITANTSVSLRVSVNGTPPFIYRWFKDGVAVPGTNGPLLTLSLFDLSRAGTYTVTVSNSVGSVTTNPAKISMRAPLVELQTAAVGKSASLLATPGSTGTVTWEMSTDAGVTWSPVTDGTNFSGATTSRLTLLAVTPQLNNTLFRYRVTLGSSSVTSDRATISTFTSPLTMPSGLGFDKAGNLYVSDAGAQTILRVGNDLRPVVLAGRQGEIGSADGSGSAARFHEPGAFFVADDGTLTLVDTSNHTIRTIASDGRVTTLAGSAGQIGTADGDTTAARFNSPVGLGVDLAGNFIISDQVNHTLRLVSGAGRTVTLAGRAGLPGISDGAPSAAQFNLPAGVVVRRDNFSNLNWGSGSNGYGTIFIADSGNHTIRVLTPGNQVGTYIGLPGSAGTQNGPRTFARLNRPTGLTMDGDGNLYIADTGSHTIRKVDIIGNVSTLAGIPGMKGHMDGGPGAALFNEPEGVTVDSARNVYVADTGNGLIRRITPTGVVSTVMILGNVPSITTQPAARNITVGASVTFSVAATGEGTLTYLWRKDGVAIPGATSASYTISSAASSDAGSYSVVVSNSWGSTTSADASLTVSTTPPAPPPPSGGNSGGGAGGGGGGSPSLLFLATTALALALRPGRRGRGLR